MPRDRRQERSEPRSGDLESRLAIEAVWRIEAARLIGGLARIVGDVGLAEDMAQDALVTALARAQTLARERGEALGPYGLQAAIAACHARARTATETDWERIVALYDALAQLRPSPVVELNRAVAVAMACGPQAGLDLVDALAAAPALRDYRLLASVRGELLARLDRHEEAHAEFRRAAELTSNARERRLMLDRAAACAWAGGGGAAGAAGGGGAGGGGRLRR